MHIGEVEMLTCSLHLCWMEVSGQLHICMQYPHRKDFQYPVLLGMLCDPHMMVKRPLPEIRLAVLVDCSDLLTNKCAVLFQC
jgi:hypothetical protein